MSVNMRGARSGCHHDQGMRIDRQYRSGDATEIRRGKEDQVEEMLVTGVHAVEHSHRDCPGDSLQAPVRPPLR